LFFSFFFSVTRMFYLFCFLKKSEFFNGVLFSSFFNANPFRIRRVERENQKKYFQPKKVIIQKKQTIIIRKS